MAYSGPELITAIPEAPGTAISGREIDAPLTVSVDDTGEVAVRRAGADR